MFRRQSHDLLVIHALQITVLVGVDLKRVFPLVFIRRLAMIKVMPKQTGLNL